MADWALIGSVVRTQIHTDEIVHGGVYDTSRLLRTESLWLTEAGVVGLSGGQAMLDYHHRNHPHLSTFRPDRQMSIGFVGHYTVISGRFGPIQPGIAAENIVVDYDGVLAKDELDTGIRIETSSGVAEFGGAEIARPCVPFTKFLLGGSVSDDESISSYRSSLDNGIRGFVLPLVDLAAPGLMVAEGDQVFRRV